MRAVLVGGARPNFMKVAPVLWALEARGVEVILVHSGQHYDAGMSDVFFEELGIRTPDVNLGAGSGTQAEQTARVMLAFEPLVADVRPDVVIVVGDVNSTVACGLVAAKAGVLLAHVEAGLRSRDWTMPEEINRVVTDRLSDFLFAPSDDAVDNLFREGYRADQVHLAGNVMVFVAPGTEADVLRRVAAHVVPDGVIVVGFHTNRDLTLGHFDACGEEAGLRIEHRFATWDLRAWRDDADFAVTVLRHR